MIDSRHSRTGGEFFDALTNEAENSKARPWGRALGIGGLGMSFAFLFESGEVGPESGEL